MSQMHSDKQKIHQTTKNVQADSGTPTFRGVFQKVNSYMDTRIYRGDIKKYTQIYNGDNNKEMGVYKRATSKYNEIYAGDVNKDEDPQIYKVEITEETQISDSGFQETQIHKNNNKEVNISRKRKIYHNHENETRLYNHIKERTLFKKQNETTIYSERKHIHSFNSNNGTKIYNGKERKLYDDNKDTKLHRETQMYTNSKEMRFYNDIKESKLHSNKRETKIYHKNMTNLNEDKDTHTQIYPDLHQSLRWPDRSDPTIEQVSMWREEGGRELSHNASDILKMVSTAYIS